MAVILGGGLGGLSAGYYLLRQQVNSQMKLVVLEATNYCGGWVKTIKNKDYIFEQGPRTIRPKGMVGLNTLNMIQELGLSQHVVPIKPDHPAAKNRMIFVKNNLHSLPSSMKSMFTINSPFTKPLIYAALHDWRQPIEVMEDDTIYNFTERRFGKEIADYAISSMICGICAGDAKEISVKFLMKTLFEWEQNHGGVIKGMMKSLWAPKSDNKQQMSDLAHKAVDEKWSVYTIRGGLDTLPNQIHRYLIGNDVKVHINSPVEEITFVDSSSVQLKGANGDTISTGHVYSTIPAHSLAKLVEKQHPELAHELSEIPFVTVGIVNLYFGKNKDLVEPAFGFLVPPIENSPILGVVFDSCCIPDQNGTVLTVMLGGKWFKEKFGDKVSEEKLLDIALIEVMSILNIKESPTAHNVSILHNCIPQYVVGHYDRVNKIRNYVKQNDLPLSLIGCSFDGVGINDVIYSAKSQVEKDSSTDLLYT